MKSYLYRQRIIASRLDLLQRRLVLALMLGRSGEIVPLATELVRLDSHRARAVVLLAEKQALAALDLARVAAQASPDETAQSPWLVALQEVARNQRPDALPAGRPSTLTEAAALLAAGRYEDAESVYELFGRMHPQVPAEQQELHELLGNVFGFAALQPEQARLIAAALCARQPDGPAMARTLIAYHRRAQNATALEALQTALSSHP